MPLYLSYDPKKGLIKSNDGVINGNCISEHDEKGWDTPLHEQSMEIPGQDVRIVVRTNFHFGSKSYMNASITMRDKLVLNFTDTNLSHSIKIVHAEPGNWEALFEGIINLYNSIYNSKEFITNYFNAIDEKLKDISSKNQDILVAITDRLAEISEELSKSIYSDSVIINNRMKYTCRKMVLNISKGYQGKWLTAGQRSKIENNLQHIFKYIAAREILFEVLLGYTPPTIVADK